MCFLPYILIKKVKIYICFPLGTEQQVVQPMAVDVRTGLGGSLQQLCPASVKTKEHP